GREIVWAQLHHKRGRRARPRKQPPSPGGARGAGAPPPPRKKPPPGGGPHGVGPRPEARPPPQRATLAGQDHLTAPPAGEQHLHPLPAQRMERVRDDYKSRKVTGRPGTMPLPWGYRAGAACLRGPAWGYPPALP